LPVHFVLNYSPSFSVSRAALLPVPGKPPVVPGKNTVQSGIGYLRQARNHCDGFFPGGLSPGPEGFVLLS